MPSRPRTSEHAPPRARRAGLAALAAVTAGLAAAAPASAINYVTTANGSSWAVNDAASPGLDTGSVGQLSDSAAIAFGGLRVRVDSRPAPRLNGELMRGFGLRFDGLDHFATTDAVQLGAVSISRDLQIVRRGDYARFLDTFSNTSSAPVSVNIGFGGSLGVNRGPGSQSVVAGSSSGDTAIGTNDSWVTVATSSGGFSPTGPTAVVLGTPSPFGGFTGTGNFQRDPFLTPLAVTGQQANFYSYNDVLTLQPGETRTVLRYFVAGRRETSGTAGQQATVVSDAADALATSPNLAGLSAAQICALANWDVTTLSTPGFDPADCAAVRPIDVNPPKQAIAPTTSSPYDVTTKTLTQMEADMEAGVTTSEQITRAYLDRIGAYDTGQFGFHAFIHVADDAMAQAKAADAARATGKSSPVLGIPVALKDLYDTKDMPTTDGTYALDGYVPHDDAFQVGKLRAAGAVLIGKANLSQFANNGSMSDSSYGQVWNAFSPSKTSLGSSGGSAVAVATRMAAFAMGTQTGVSLYAPSTGAGLTTFRGTDGMASTRGVMPLTWATDYAGPIAQNVSDVAAILDVVTGTDPGDLQLTADADAHKPAEWKESLDPNALRGKKIGYLPSSFVSTYASDDGTADAVRAKFSALETAGATMVSMTPQPSAPVNTARGGNAGTEGWERYIAEHPEFPFANAAGILQSPRNLPYNRRGGTAAPYDDENAARLLQFRAAYRQVIGQWMDDNDVDAIVYPGFLSDVWDNDGATTLSSDRGSGVLTQSAGLPTVILPVGLNPHGDPMSMQLMGREWSDPQVLGMGYALEREIGSKPKTSEAPPLRYAPGIASPPVVVERPAPPTTEPPVQTPPEESRDPAPVPPAAPVAAVVPPAPAPPEKKPAPAKTVIKATPAASATTKAGKVRLVLSNGSAARLTGTVTLRAKLGKKTIVLGSGKLSVAAKKRGTLVVTLSRAAKKALGRRAQVTATATYALRNATGAKVTKTAKLTIRLR